MQTGKAYSLDLRERVIAGYQKGKTTMNEVGRCRQKYELDGRKDRRVVKIMNQQPHRVTQHI